MKKTDEFLLKVNNWIEKNDLFMVPVVLLIISNFVEVLNTDIISKIRISIIVVLLFLVVFTYRKYNSKRVKSTVRWFIIAFVLSVYKYIG